MQESSDAIPAHLRRYLTSAARAKLAARFNLPDAPDMQDWEWMVADTARIDEFLAGYESGELDEDERFGLMETLIQCFAELPEPLAREPRWARVLDILDANPRLHLHSIWYWSNLDSPLDEDNWTVAPFMRELQSKYRPSLA